MIKVIRNVSNTSTISITCIIRRIHSIINVTDRCRIPLRFCFRVAVGVSVGIGSGLGMCICAFASVFVLVLVLVLVLVFI